jgi:hypothetical protein
MITLNGWSKMTSGSLWAAAAVMTLSVSVSGQDHEKRSIPEQVTSAMMQEKATGTTHPDGTQEGNVPAAGDTMTERDAASIRSGVRSSRTFIVIKALALGLAIAGLGVVYIPRRTGVSS